MLSHFKILISSIVAFMMTGCVVTVFIKVETNSEQQSPDTATISHPHTATISGDALDFNAGFRINNFDASLFELDISQSSVIFPSSGLIVFQLINSQNVVSAVKSFSWTKVGGKLMLSNPTAVENWVQAVDASNPVSSVKYDLQQIPIGTSPGLNTISAVARYGTNFLASDTISFTEDVPKCVSIGECYIP